MAAGDVFNARLSVASTRDTLDNLLGAGAKLYSYISLRASVGSVAIGNATVTQANGFQLAEFEELIINSGSAIGANINLIGPGTVDFLGITSA